MKYCQKCILPTSRPNIVLDKNGICCTRVLEKEQIDWSSRLAALENIFNDVKKINSPYDCVIPVSGGKDSTWQVLKILDMGLKPLCVTWKTPARTEIGANNLSNLISLGADHIDFTINPIIEKKLSKISFIETGIPALPMHLAIFSIPTRIALCYKIPLIVWGENSAFEYGGISQLANTPFIDRKWLSKYGVSDNTFAEDWVSEDLSAKELYAYTYPSNNEILNSNLKGIFLGHYLKWNARDTYEIAKASGFQASDKPLLGAYDFADIDDNFIMPVHHWLKWYKFGITRTWDNLSLDIRSGLITRNDAIKKLESIGYEKPTNAIEQYCKFIDISTEEFDEICNKFRNPKVWKKNSSGNFYIEKFLINNWNWDEAKN